MYSICIFTICAFIRHKIQDTASQVALWQRLCLPMQKTHEKWVQSLGQKDLLEKEMATNSGILPGIFHGQRSLAGYRHRESDMTE